MIKKIIRYVCRNIVNVLFRLELSGFETIEKTKPKLYISNHESFLDGFLLGLVIPENPVFIVHTAVAKNPLFKLLLSLVDYLAVDPTSPMAMKKAIDLIKNNRSVVIFPEGRITVTGSLMKVYSGPAFIAFKTGVDIYPIVTSGLTYTYFSRMENDYPKSLFPKIKVKVLPKTKIEIPNVISAKEKRRLAGDTLRKIMQNMFFERESKSNIYDVFLEASKIYGKQKNILQDFTMTEYKYSDIKSKSELLGVIIKEKIKINEYYGFLLPNSASAIFVLLGSLLYKRIPAMLNYSNGVEGIFNACYTAKIKTIITSRKFLTQIKLENIKDDLEAKNYKLEIIYLEDVISSMNIFTKIKYKIQTYLIPINKPKIKETDTAFILFTSGSEGKPKGVVLSHKAVLSNVAQMKSVIDFSIKDKIFNALPVFHAFGLTCGTLLPVLSGVRLFIYPSPLHYKVIPEVIYDRQCSILFGTSTFLGNYAKHANPYDFYNIKYVVAGAEKLSEDVKNLYINKFGIRILEGYGSTEFSPVVAVNTPMAFKENTVGQLLPNIEYKLEPIQDNNGSILHIKGNNMMSGYMYFDKPCEIVFPENSYAEGFYNTGDVISMDDNGFVSIVGRIKRFVKIAGEMVSLGLVENIALKVSPGYSHVAISIPDAQKGEMIILYTTDKDLSRDKLIVEVKNQKVSDLAIAKKIKYIESIPLTGTGKTDYQKLKESWLEERVNV